jgi:hypothetical protein
MEGVINDKRTRICTILNLKVTTPDANRNNKPVASYKEKKIQILLKAQELLDHKNLVTWTNMAWFGLAKIALQAGSKLYTNRQRTKMAMSDARLMHAERMARGEESYQGKLLEARQNDYKDEIVLRYLRSP